MRRSRGAAINYGAEEVFIDFSICDVLVLVYGQNAVYIAEGPKERV